MVQGGHWFFFGIFWPLYPWGRAPPKSENWPNMKISKFFNHVDILLIFFGIKIRKKWWKNFCSTTNTFWIIATNVVFFGYFRKIYEKYHICCDISKSICRRSNFFSPFLSAFNSATNEYNIDQIGEFWNFHNCPFFGFSRGSPPRVGWSKNSEKKSVSSLDHGAPLVRCAAGNSK